MLRNPKEDGNLLCVQYFGSQSERTFLDRSLLCFKENIDNIIYNLSNPSQQQKIIEVSNNKFLTNYETLAQLVIIEKKKETNINKIDEYFNDIFKSNIEKFINVGELLVKKYFNCNSFNEWERNIEQLLDHHRRNYKEGSKEPITADSIIISKLSSSTTNNENIIKQLDINYGILNANMSEWKINQSGHGWLGRFKFFTHCFTVTTVLEYFVNNYEKKFIKLSPTTIDEEKKLLKKRIEELEHSNTQQQSTISNLQQQPIQNNLQKTQSNGMDNNQSKEQNSKLELQLSQSNQQVQNLKDVNNQLNDKIIELQLQLSHSKQQQQSNLQDVNYQLKERISKLELQLSQANTILSLNNVNLIQQKYRTI